MTINDLKGRWNREMSIEHCNSPAELTQFAMATARRAEWKVSLFEFWIIAVFGALGAATLLDAIRRGEPWHGYPAPMITLGIVVYVYLGRRQRRRRTDFSRSLPEIVESELQAIDDHLDRIKSFLWRFVFPLTFAVAIQAAFDSVNRPLWVWAMLPLGVTAVWWAMQMAAQASHLPHREKLILVQAKLSAGEA